jgi:hypothetical protein
VVALIRVFIGYDEREAAAFSVLSSSIHRHASRPVAIAPVMLSELCGVFQRERNPLQSTDFSFSRFLVPWLCDYQGWALFMDCDMLARDDLAKLWDLREERYAVQVVKHVHVPREDTKFLGAVQTKYEKKNWTSVMLMNCARCTALTPDYVNRASGLELHQFKWLEGDHLIGAMPAQWNHLVGYDAPRRDASIVHYTIGGPYFEEYRDCEYAQEWWDEMTRMEQVTQRAKAAKAS